MKKGKLRVLTAILSAVLVVSPMANAAVYADDFDTFEYTSDADDGFVDDDFTDEDFADEDAAFTFDEDTFDEETSMEELDEFFTEETEEESSDETEDESETETEIESETETEDEFEAGSTIAAATAYTFGNTVSGNISASNTVDYYKFTLSKSGQISINYNWYMRYSAIRIYDENQNPLSLTKKEMTWDSAIEQGHENDSYVLTAGTYYFAVLRRYSNSDSYGDYDFKITYTASNETYNESQSKLYNTKDLARTINKNTTYKGALGINDAVDFYKFTLSESGLVDLRLTVDTDFKKANIEIYDSETNKITSGTAYGESSNTLNKSMYLKSGTYYLRVATGYDGSQGNYNFKYTFKSAGETIKESITDTDNTMNTARSISIGTQYYGQLADADDSHDYYKFTLSSKAYITLTANSEMSRIDYYIVDSDGVKKFSSGAVYSDSTGYGHLTKSVELPAGTYYLDVARTYSGNYNFRLDKNLKYTITYNPNSQYTVSGFPKTEYAYPGNKYTIISTTPARNGYTFKGWYTAKSGGSRVYAGSSVEITENTTYYAQWTAKSGVEGFVTRMYNVCLLRDPDTTGYNYWIEKLRSGKMTGKEVAHGFIFSNEFVGRKLSNADYVERLYESFLGRSSDASGKKYWVNKLKNGASRETVFNGFVDSTEFKKICQSYGIKVK